MIDIKIYVNGITLVIKIIAIVIAYTLRKTIHLSDFVLVPYGLLQHLLVQSSFCLDFIFLIRLPMLFVKNTPSIFENSF